MYPVRTVNLRPSGLPSICSVGFGTQLVFRCRLWVMGTVDSGILGPAGHRYGLGWFLFTHVSRLWGLFNGFLDKTARADQHGRGLGLTGTCGFLGGGRGSLSLRPVAVPPIGGTVCRQIIVRRSGMSPPNSAAKMVEQSPGTKSGGGSGGIPDGMPQGTPEGVPAYRRPIGRRHSGAANRRRPGMGDGFWGR